MTTFREDLIAAIQEVGIGEFQMGRFLDEVEAADMADAVMVVAELHGMKVDYGA